MDKFDYTKSIIDSLFLEHTSSTNPDDRDTFTVQSDFETLKLIFRTIQYYDETSTVSRDFWNPSPEIVKDERTFTLSIDEARMMAKKLQEFVDIYDEYQEYNFIFSEEEKPYRPFTVDSMSENELVEMVKRNCDIAGILCEEKNSTDTDNKTN